MTVNSETYHNNDVNMTDENQITFGDGKFFMKYDNTNDELVLSQVLQ